MSQSDDDRFRRRALLFGLGAEVVIPAVVLAMVGLYVLFAE